jgi:hypothetical protein
VSRFLHCTVSPPVTVTFLGANPVLRMLTFFVASPAANAYPPTPSAHTAAIMSSFFIRPFPLELDGYGVERVDLGKGARWL